MKNILILSASAFLISCDDFFSPTIEIFNEVKTPVNIEQEHKQEQKKEQKQNNSSDTIIIGDQEYLVN